MRFEEIMNNPLSKEWREIYFNQPQDIQKKLDDLKEQNSHIYQLKVIRRKRIKPQKGDVFLLSPIRGIYFYGIVLNDGICNINGNDLLAILIFKTKTQSLDDKNFEFDLNDLLIKPSIVGKEYWSKGFFYNVGQYIFNDVDYGFYDVIDDKFYDEYENELNKKPKLIGMYGVSTITGIAYSVWQELIIDENLLLENGC